jgi:hypothetical protein
MDRVYFNSRFRQSLTRIVCALCAGWMLAVVSGCVILEKYTGSRPAESNEPVGRVDMFFQPFIRIVDDTQHPGVQIPGLAGRVWLFSESGKHTVTPRGTIEAELYDLTSGAVGAKATKLAQWKFAAHDLKALKQDDKIGMGYTLFLPWEDYTPAFKKVQLHVTFIAADGSKHATVPATLNLRSEQEATEVHMEKRVVPVTFTAPQK